MESRKFIDVLKFRGVDIVDYNQYIGLNVEGILIKLIDIYKSLYSTKETFRLSIVVLGSYDGIDIGLFSMSKHISRIYVEDGGNDDFINNYENILDAYGKYNDIIGKISIINYEDIYSIPINSLIINIRHENDRLSIDDLSIANTIQDIINHTNVEVILIVVHSLNNDPYFESFKIVYIIENGYRIYPIIIKSRILENIS